MIILGQDASMDVFALVVHPMALNIVSEQLDAHEGIPVEFSNWQYTLLTKDKKPKTRTKIMTKEGW